MDEDEELLPNHIVIVTQLPPGYESGYPFKEGDRMLYLGEIPNMPGGHCIVVNQQGRVHWGYHTEYFRKPTEDEL
jgi:hypothetical protein